MESLKTKNIVSLFIILKKNLHPAATKLTTIDVDVDELCTATVTRMPIINPTMGLLNKG
jgi:hypothetical protein